MVTHMLQPNKKGRNPRIGGNVKWAFAPVKSPITPKTKKIAPMGMVITAQILSKVVMG